MWCDKCANRIFSILRDAGYWTEWPTKNRLISRSRKTKSNLPVYGNVTTDDSTAGKLLKVAEFKFWSAVFAAAFAFSAAVIALDWLDLVKYNKWLRIMCTLHVLIGRQKMCNLGRSLQPVWTAKVTWEEFFLGLTVYSEVLTIEMIVNSTYITITYK